MEGFEDILLLLLRDIDTTLYVVGQMAQNGVWQLLLILSEFLG